MTLVVVLNINLKQFLVKLIICLFHCDVLFTLLKLKKEKGVIPPKYLFVLLS